MGRTLRVMSGAAVGTVLGVLSLVGTAQAHVTVNPVEAEQGGYARLAFRVPTESDTVSTTKVEVFLPTDQPIASVSVMPVPGWTATVTHSKLAKPLTTDDGDKVTEAVTKIGWTASSAQSAIKPGQFQEFPVSLGPLPEVAAISFKALQTYSDGSVVRWIEQPTSGGSEPEHPAPTLTLTKAGADSETTTAGAGGQAVGAKSDDDSNASGAALAVGIVGGVLGLIGIALGGLALSRTRRAG